MSDRASGGYSIRAEKKRKFYSKGKSNANYKRFRRDPKYVRENLENKIAREKERDIFTFTDSDDDYGADLGMGLELSDLPFLLDEDNNPEKTKQFIALTQDSVTPLFYTDKTSSDEQEAKLKEALDELRFKAFRTNQKETVSSVLHGKSTLFISPTGSGKSLCYQVPALLYWRYRKYMTLVVSPLISLMEDQVNNFPKCLQAVCIHSGHNKVQRDRSIQKLVNHEAQVAFISPEAIVNGLLDIEDLRNLPPIGFVCIDEAHCLSEWSHNFRPAYFQFIQILKDKMNIKTFLGLTATATRATSTAIANSLTINPDEGIIGSTAIPDNLILSVSFERNKELALIELLKSPTFIIMPSIIIYCNRREETEHISFRIRAAMQKYKTFIEKPGIVKSTTLSENTASNCQDDGDSRQNGEKEHVQLGWTAECYHAGLSSDTRRRIQTKFIKGEIRVVVATMAFGMGINKANIRAIIHYDMPSSFESYVQEIGRAGRDGKPAQCHMFLTADQADLYYHQRNIYAAVAEQESLKKLINILFKPCRCKKTINSQKQVELDELNCSTPHSIPDCDSKAVDHSVTGLDDHFRRVSAANQSKATDDKENGIASKSNKNSIVKLHRACEFGHEISIDIEKLTEEVNLKLESILTIIQQLRRFYPQLGLELYTPIKSLCTVFCYKGPKQMESLRETTKTVSWALFQHKKEQIKTHGVAGETPAKLTFDIVEMATARGMTYKEATRQLRQLEWEKVEDSGKFRRSQIKVKFHGHSLHMKAVGDLDSDEISEIGHFLFDLTNLYIKIEKAKLTRVYNTMNHYCIGLDKMKDKAIRLEASSNLKVAVDTYFDATLEKHILPSMSDAKANQQLDEDELERQAKLVAQKENLVRRSAIDFLSAHGPNHHPKNIARIFQGISTPLYPAEIWGYNRKWWRRHLDMDFTRIAEIVRDLQVRTRET